MQSATAGNNHRAFDMSKDSTAPGKNSSGRKRRSILKAIEVAPRGRFNDYVLFAADDRDVNRAGQPIRRGEISILLKDKSSGRIGPGHDDGIRGRAKDAEARPHHAEAEIHTQIKDVGTEVRENARGRDGMGNIIQ